MALGTADETYRVRYPFRVRALRTLFPGARANSTDVAAVIARQESCEALEAADRSCGALPSLNFGLMGPKKGSDDEEVVASGEALRLVSSYAGNAGGGSPQLTPAHR